MVEATSKMGGVSLITADHGNAERMLDADGVTPYTAHTTNPVPFYIVGADVKLRDGRLADIAPPCWTSWAWKSPLRWTAIH